ncbi:MAG: transglycosylase domain-containing protein [Flavobacteriales bacterium]
MTNRKKIVLVWTTISLPFVVLMLTIYLTSLGIFGSLPSFEQLENPKNNLATELISEDGVVLGKFFYENRTNARFSEISQHLIDALIATEDIRFYKHSGIDLIALLRAVKGQLFGGSSGGASTISQQLAKMLFTEKPATGFERVMQKLKEWVIAVRLERQYTKEEIMTMYLNKFDFVNNAVGIKSAAQVYFNTTASELSVLESAMLVGMFKNPSLYNPNRRLELTTQRRNVVLNQMKKYGFLENTLADSLKNAPIVLDFKKASHNEGLAPYLREYLRIELKKWCKENKKADGTNYNLYTDGLKIYTGINSRMQAHAEEGLKTHLSSLQKDFFKHWKGYTNAPFPKDFTNDQINSIIDQAMKRTERYRRLKNVGKKEKEIRKIFNTKVPMTVFSWEGERDTIMSPRDSIRYYKYFINSGMMSMDPSTGLVKAYVGGINYKHFKYDHVKVGKRQVGSTFKPFLYALAMQEGYSPCYEVPNVPVIFEKEKWGLPEKDWIPKNSDDKYDGMLLSMKFGLANSINTITAYIMKQFGPHAVLELARKMGITNYLQAVPSICLGTFDLSVYEMVGAYSTFVNKGLWVEPMLITKIEDKNGVVIQEFQPKVNEAMSKETADIMVRMLQGVVDGVYNSDADVTMGTGVRLRRKYNFKNNIGGKTGTTQNNSDGWFMGITPQLVTGVWSGNEDRSAHFRTTFYGQGANMALPVWAEYMQRVYNDSIELGIYPQEFDIPQSIDLLMDCQANKQGNENNLEEEF